MTSNLLTAFSLALIICIGGCASTQANSNNLNSAARFTADGYLADTDKIKSGIPTAEYRFFDIYFSAAQPPSLPTNFVISINKCINNEASSIVRAGQGYKVLKSFGYSDEKILIDGTKSCMEAKGWYLYQQNNGELKRVTYNDQFYSKLTESELERTKVFLLDRLAWYKQYAPEVLDK